MQTFLLKNLYIKNNGSIQDFLYIAMYYQDIILLLLCRMCDYLYAV